MCTNLPNIKLTVPSPHPMAYVALGYPIKKKLRKYSKKKIVFEVPLFDIFKSLYYNPTTYKDPRIN